MQKTFGLDCFVTGQKKVANKTLLSCEKTGKQLLLSRNHGAHAHKIIYPLTVNANLRTKVKRIRIGYESDLIRLCTCPIHIRLV